MDHPTGNTQRIITIAARMGYVAKGVVYILIGGLAFMAAIGLGGQRGGTSEALHELAVKPFGGFMLAAMAVGLLAYTAWRIIQAIFDAENKGRGFKGLCTRGGFVISGLIYGALAINSIKLLLSSGGSGSGSTQSRTAELMSHPGGLIAVFVIGVIFGFVGLRQWWRAWKQSYRKNWHTQEMPAHQLHIADVIARWGLTARGLVFLIMSGFICLAALHTNPQRARGLGGALETLADQPFGPWILGVVALGLVAYGIYCFVNARYRNVNA
ncbi:DUF1206 domain-containing protein [Kushneria phosphatilytica]|uniref:DUF1206 domain-containing protein n=1 Tax=Kushneria phosphatilytica TaxID=657387 RepID=UPI001F2CA82A|nr:DUF1206 domain-containing protein [Kushneria phosphatilytica]